MVTLDALRGFALLGILVPNIVYFAWPTAAGTDPSVIGPSPWNHFAHDLTSTVFLGKFMFLFAMMFGAGVVIFDRKTAPTDRPARLSDGAGLWHRRCAVLLGIGVLHAYGLWYGDILVGYAVAGLTVVWWVRKLSPVTQLVLGGSLFLLGTALLAGLTALSLWAVSMGKAPAGDVLGPSPALETAAYLGSYPDAFLFRAPFTLSYQVFMGIFYTPAICGIMTIGMGLTRLGVLTGQRSLRFHATLGIVGVVVGGLATFGAYRLVGDSGLEHPGYLWQTIAQAVGAPLAIGYSQLVVGAARTRALAAPTRALALVGRMALTNYLLQTVLCTTLMYGYGFGLFASIGYPGLLGIVLAVWIVNTAFSALWLRFFAFGPAEWMWRRLTYPEFKTGSRG